MTTGHFALAAGTKAATNRVPLWALLVSAYLLDFVFIVLVGMGVESFAQMNPANPAYGQVIIEAYYSHSLVGAVVIAGIAALVALPAWGKRGSLVVGGLVISHWILDLVVHRADMPILPGNTGGAALLGFGLWNYPIASGAIELGLVALGVYVYFRSTRPRRSSVGSGAAGSGRWGVVSTVAVAVGLVAMAAADFLAMPTFVGLGIMVALIAVCGWFDSRVSLPARRADPSPTSPG